MAVAVKINIRRDMEVDPTTYRAFPTEYGAWILPNGNILRVPHENHLPTMEKYLGVYCDYVSLYMNGAVRVAYSGEIGRKMVAAEYRGKNITVAALRTLRRLIVNSKVREADIWDADNYDQDSTKNKGDILAIIDARIAEKTT